MTKFETPQSIVRAGFARADVTPPVGIYHRMWGAAVHDTATGVHLPLTATALWLDRITGGDPLVIVGLDHCVFNSDEFTLLRERISQALRIDPARVQIALSHTHGSGWMGRNRSHFPGGDKIGPYLDHQTEVCAELAVAAAACAEPATIVYGTGQ